MADNCVYARVSETKCLNSQAQAYCLLPTTRTGWLWILVTRGTRKKWHILNHLVNKRHEAGLPVRRLITCCASAKSVQMEKNRLESEEKILAKEKSLEMHQHAMMPEIHSCGQLHRTRLTWLCPAFQQWEFNTWVNVALESVWVCAIIKKGKSPKLGRS